MSSLAEISENLELFQESDTNTFIKGLEQLKYNTHKPPTPVIEKSNLFIRGLQNLESQSSKGDLNVLRRLKEEQIIRQEEKREIKQMYADYIYKRPDINDKYKFNDNKTEQILSDITDTEIYPHLSPTNKTSSFSSHHNWESREIIPILQKSENFVNNNRNNTKKTKIIKSPKEKNIEIDNFINKESKNQIIDEDGFMLVKSKKKQNVITKQISLEPENNNTTSEIINNNNTTSEIINNKILSEITNVPELDSK